MNNYIYWDHSDFLWAENILRIHGLADWRLRIVENIVAAPGFKQNDATGHYSGYCRREEKVIEILLDESRAEFHDTFLHELAHVWISGHDTDWQTNLRSSGASSMRSLSPSLAPL